MFKKSLGVVIEKTKDGIVANVSNEDVNNDHKIVEITEVNQKLDIVVENGNTYKKVEDTKNVSLTDSGVVFVQEIFNEEIYSINVEINHVEGNDVDGAEIDKLDHR